MKYTIEIEPKKQTQSEKAYDIIKKMIKYGEVPEDETISIATISEQLKLGRSPVSVACQKLEYEKIIKIIPKQGIMVTDLSLSETRHIYETRAVIECFFAEKAYDKMTAADIEYMNASIDKQFVFVKDRNPYGFTDENILFHSFPMQKYDNHVMKELYNELQDRVYLISIKNLSHENRYEESIKEHRTIVKGFKNKDKTGLIKAIQEHIFHGVF